MTNGISIDFTRDKDGFANSISVTNHTAQKASTTCLGKAKASVPDTLPAVREALIDLGVAPHTLMRFIEMAEAGEITPQQAYINTIEREEKAQEFYVEQSLKPWADRHGLTLKQAVSIAFNDHEFNPETKKDDLPSYRGLFWASGAQNSFLLRLQKDLQDSPEVSAERATELLHRNYRASKAEDVAQSLYKATHALPPCNLADLVMDALTEIHMLRAKLSAAILEKAMLDINNCQPGKGCQQSCLLSCTQGNAVVPTCVTDSVLLKELGIAHTTTRNSDRLDFHDVHIASLRKLVERAYLDGRASVLRAQGASEESILAEQTRPDAMTP